MKKNIYDKNHTKPKKTCMTRIIPNQKHKKIELLYIKKKKKQKKQHSWAPLRAPYTFSSKSQLSAGSADCSGSLKAENTAEKTMVEPAYPRKSRGFRFSLLFVFGQVETSSCYLGKIGKIPCAGRLMGSSFLSCRVHHFFLTSPSLPLAFPSLDAHVFAQSFLVASGDSSNSFGKSWKPPCRPTCRYAKTEVWHFSRRLSCSPSSFLHWE